MVLNRRPRTPLGRAYDTNSGLTASTTQTQGQGRLNAVVNEIATVANDNDVVTLPSAIAFREVTVINNGLKTLQVFPASGDNLGAGVNNSDVLEINETETFLAYGDTNWVHLSGTQIAHGEMVDFNNADAFVITTQDVHTAYHSNGIAAGDLDGAWTFDTGGGGTNVAIASIADGAVSGVDIAVTCGAAHNLAVGAIVSISTGTAAYDGTHKVKAIISSTIFEVAAVFGSTDTGTMDEAATLLCPTGGTGTYLCTWSMDGTSGSNNHVFDFAIHIDSVHQGKTNGRLRFGTAGDVTGSGRTNIIDITAGEKVSWMARNTSGSANITIRHFTLVLVRL